MKRIKQLLSVFVMGSLLFSCSGEDISKKAYNAGINIIPIPVSLVQNEGVFVLNESTKLSASSPEMNTIAEYFIAKMNKATGYQIAMGEVANNNIKLTVNPELECVSNEGYTLNVTPSSVEIVGKSAAGVFYGMQTFLQLLPAEIESTIAIEGVKWSAPAVTIKDEPRFKYRGMHLDVTRHFSDVDFIKKQLDVLAMFKINRFHWHLTDDQLWTIEIKKYPNLTKIGADRLEGEGTRHKGFYTQEQIKEVVKYANERFIDVIPEIELPGHGLAALAAYPEYSCTGGPFQIRNVWGVEADVFCAGKEETFAFLEDIISEVAPLFTSEYFHIGGDECPKDRWKECPLCKARMKKEKLKDTYELQSYFVQRIEKHVNKLGKKLIGWNEILEGGIAPNATIMSWQGEAGGIHAANEGHDVIMTPGGWLYLDHCQGATEVEPMSFGGNTTLEKTYNYNPVPKDIKEENAHHVIGAQGNVWAEYLYTPELREYSIYPRIIAVAELTWTPLDKKDYKDFERRINNAYVRLDMHDINYHIPLPTGPVSNYMAFIDTISLEIENSRNYPMVYTLDGSQPKASSQIYTNALSFDKNTVLNIATLLPSGKLSNTRSITVNKEVLSPAVSAESKQGIKKSTLEGHFLNSAAYKDKKFSEPEIVKYFTKGLDYNKPSVEKYEGYFEVPEDGIYTITSDNEELWIDDILVIDNNNQVKRHLRTKSTKALAKGKHKYTLIMNNSIMGGWPNSWSENTFFFKAPSATKYTKVSEDILSY